MLTASSMYALNINECASLIENVGPKRTVVVRGDMGWGKTSILKILKARLGDKYAYAYFDCTTKMDSGDIHLPDFATTDDGTKYVRYVPTEEYGLHYGKPVVLCIDEIGKAEKGTKNALMRDMLERDRFIAGSIIFATTNHALEKVGDILMPHHRNRLIVVTMRKSKQDEWIENFAYAANIHPAVISWVGEHPELFQSFMDLMDDKGEISKVNRDSNPMIYIPGDVDRESFVTGRSLEAASDVVHALENRVTDKLPRAVVRDVTTAVDLHQLGADVDRITLQVLVEFRTRSVREDVRVLEQQQVLTLGVGEQRLLQRERLAVGNASQPADVQRCGHAGLRARRSSRGSRGST